MLRCCLPVWRRVVRAGTLTRYCGESVTGVALACPPVHNPSSPLNVILGLNTNLTSLTSIAWSYRAGSAAATALANTAAKPQYAQIPAADLPTSGTVTVSARLVSPYGTGTATLSVRINSPPQCTNADGSCLGLDATTGTFPMAQFVASVSNWLDTTDKDSALSYEYGTYTAAGGYSRQVVTPASKYTFKGFTPGSYSLYACALNAYGARTCERASVTVSEPAGQVDVASVLAATVDVSALNATQDTQSLVQAAQQAKALLKFAASSGNTTAVNATAAAEKAAAMSKIQNGLIVALAAQSSGSDTTQALNVLSAVSSLATSGVGPAPFCHVLPAHRLFKLVFMVSRYSIAARGAGVNLCDSAPDGRLCYCK